jgi:hypothetical protein
MSRLFEWAWKVVGRAGGIARWILVLGFLAAAATPAEAQTHARLTSKTVSGDTKTCYYKANGNVHTRLVGRSRPCPLSIPIREPLPRPRPD